MSLWRKKRIYERTPRLLMAFHPKALTTTEVMAGLLALHIVDGLPIPDRNSGARDFNNTYVNYSCGDSYGITPYSLLIFWLTTLKQKNHKSSANLNNFLNLQT